jgi:NTP pyrophosphatase (non-canonical NTP hydrolase)
MTQEKLSPWTPDTNKTNLRVLGKAAEEAGEYGSALARCIIQGINESEPVTGKPNKEWLEEEVADVLATIDLLILKMALDWNFIKTRTVNKLTRLEGWVNDMEEREKV